MAFQEKKSVKIRSQLWDILHDGKGALGHLFSVLLVIFIILSVALLPLELSTAFATYHELLIFLEILLAVIFTIEYVLRIYAAPKRWRYISSFYGIIDLFSILPFYVGLLGTEYLRIFRLTRLIRLLKIGGIEALAAIEKSASEVGLLPEETVEYVISKHPVYLLLGMMPSLLATSTAIMMLLLFPFHPIGVTLSLILILFAVLFLWKTLLDYNYDVIYVTSHRLIFQNWHLLGRDMNQMNYRAITNVKPRYSGIIGYILGFGSITIETPAVEAGKIEDKLVRSHEVGAQCIMEKCFKKQAEGDVRLVTG